MRFVIMARVILAGVIMAGLIAAALPGAALAQQTTAAAQITVGVAGERAP